MFIGSHRPPLLRSPVGQYKVNNAPRSGSINIATISLDDEISHMTSEKTLSSELPRWLRSEHAPVSVVDWDHWYPTKYQCVFCKDRFLLDTGLQNHLLTHKRHRRYLKWERNHTKLNSNDDLNVDTSTHDPFQNALVYRQLQPAKDTDTLVSPDEALSLDDIVTDRSTEQTTSLALDIAPLGRLHTFNSGETNSRTYKLSQTNFRGDTPSESLDETSSTCCFEKLSNKHGDNVPVFVSRPNVRGPSTHLGVTKDRLGEVPKLVGIRSDSSRDGQYSGGSSGLDDFADIEIFDLELDADHRRYSNERNLSISSLVATMKQNLITCILDEFVVISKQNRVANIRNHGSSSESTQCGTGRPESKTNCQISSTSRGRQLHREDNDNEGPGEGDGDGDGDGDDRRTPKRPRTISTPSRALKESSKFACPYRKYDPRKYCVQNWRPCALTALDSVSRVKFVIYPASRNNWC